MVDGAGLVVVVALGVIGWYFLMHRRPAARSSHGKEGEEVTAPPSPSVVRERRLQRLERQPTHHDDEAPMDATKKRKANTEAQEQHSTEDMKKKRMEHMDAPSPPHTEQPTNQLAQERMEGEHRNTTTPQVLTEHTAATMDTTDSKGTAGTLSSPSRAVASNAAPVQSPSPQRSHEATVHRLVSQIFSVTINAKERDRDGFVYLDDLAQSLVKADGSSGFLEQSHIDLILIECMEHFQAMEGFSYLVKCFKSLLEQEKRASDLVEGDFFEHSRRSITTQFELLIEMHSTEFLSLLESRPGSSTSVPLQMISELCKQFQEEFPQMLRPVLQQLALHAMRISLLSSTTLSPHSALLQLSMHPNLVEFMTSEPNWIPLNVNGRQHQLQSFFGPFLQPTALYEMPDVGELYFQNPTKLTLPNVESGFNLIRMQLGNIQDALHQIVLNFFKAGPTGKEGMLKWFSQTLLLNKPRSQLNFNSLSTSTDGFMLNACSLFLKLSEPIVSSQEKMSKIDVRFCVANQRVDFTNETRIGMTSQEVEEWLEQQGTGAHQFSFLTEIFFMSHYCMHIGVSSVVSKFKDVLRELSSLKKRKSEIQRGRDSWNQREAMMMQQLLIRVEQRTDVLLKQKLCLDAQMFDPKFMQSALNFYVLTGEWIVKIGHPENTSESVVKSDLVPAELRILPEFIVQDMAEYLLFILKFQPKGMELHLISTLLKFLISFIGSNQHIKNPYLRSKLVEILYELLSEDNGKNGLPLLGITDIFSNNPIAVKHLVPALISIYVDIEQTGRSHQFYEKFYVRRHIAVLLKQLRGLEAYHTSIQEESKNTELFVKFINMLINDSHYLLDEVLIKLPKIREIEIEMEDHAWMSQPESTRRDREGLLSQYSSEVSSYCLLANETILLFNFLSQHTIEPFLVPEMITRITEMLNYFISHLAGPKSLSLKVRDPKRFHFDPRLLLTAIAQIYLHLNADSGFVQYVVNDGHFKKETFEQTIKFLKRENLLPEEKIQDFEEFVQTAESAHRSVIQQVEELGEIPDEMMDPISCDIMKDPVILPSGNTVDRATITRHLLSDATDPFNRAHLTVDMLKPNVELKEKIQAFLTSRVSASGKQEI